MAPTLSVVIPVFNAEAYVARAIQSVLNQTFEDFELIVVDDGSTDSSPAICESFADPRIRIVRQENRRLAGARNTGIRCARGRHVAFLDADDMFTTDKLERHVQHFETNPYLGVSFSHSAIIDSRGVATGKRQCGRGGSYDLEALIRESPLGNGSAPVIRMRALRAVSYIVKRHGKRQRTYFDENLAACEDVDLLWRIAYQTPWTVACLPEVLTLYRQRPAGLSANTARMFRGWEQAIQNTRGYAPEVVTRVERQSRALFLRYLAGRAVAAGNGNNAWDLIREAVRSDPAILRSHPRASILTLAAAGAVRMMPARLRPSSGRRGSLE